MAKKNSYKVTDKEIENLVDLFLSDVEEPDGKNARKGYRQYLQSSEKTAFEYGAISALAALAAQLHCGEPADEAIVQLEKIKSITAAKMNIPIQLFDILFDSPLLDKLADLLGDEDDDEDDDED